MADPQTNNQHPKESTDNQGRAYAILMWVERVGNKLPHPASLFVIITVFILLLAELFKGTTVEIPGTNDSVTAVGLLNADGLRWFVEDMLINFIEFPPFRAVLVTMLGVAMAEHTGLFQALSKRIFLRINYSLVTAAVILAGIMSNLASDAGMIFMPALAASVFAAMGRNPLVGIAAGYASASSGYFANLLITSHDATLTGITAAALDIVPATQGAPAHIAINWYMAIASVLVLVPVGTWVTNRFVEPKFSKVKINKDVEKVDYQLTTAERKGLLGAGVVLIVYLAVIAILAIPSDGVLRNPETGGLILAEFNPVIPVIAFAFFICGLTYGIIAGNIKNDKDVVDLMAKGMSTLSVFLVIAFAASQLIAIFQETNLATIVAVTGASFIQTIGLSNILLIIIFLVFIAITNLFLYSGTSKWALLAPVFVPMFGLLDFSPSFTLALYRIADSSTNAISPLFPYLPIVLGLAMKYQKNAGIGTILAVMLPYSVVFFIVWTLLAITWYLLGIPVGPGAPIFLE